jgi:S-(hydroxymethyl)glutathione dehydrogenase/alcohol dehydrogenase
MKAAILTELNKDLEIRDDVEVTGLGPQDVHVKIAASGVCHSDVSAQNGTIPAGTPTVLGHEGAGVVQAVGDAVTGVAPGDHVILSFTPACSVCKPCLRHQSFLCDQTITQAISQHYLRRGADRGRGRGREDPERRAPRYRRADRLWCDDGRRRLDQ